MLFITNMQFPSFFARPPMRAFFYLDGLEVLTFAPYTGGYSFVAGCTMKTIESLLHPDWIICVDDENRVLKDHSLAIDDGKIIDILPTAEANQAYTAEHTHILTGHALIPGLINSHTHAPMNLFRGLADDLPLMQWLEQHIWPAEQKWVSRDFVRDGARLAIAEMLRGGTTCFNDMYFFPDVVAEQAKQAGIRASIGLIVIDFPTVWANNADEYISKGLQLHREIKDEPLLSTALAPHAPYTVSDAPLAELVRLGDEMAIPLHMHIHETPGEIAMAVEQTGLRPLQRLDQLGVLSPRLMAVHMTQLNNDEITLLAQRGSHVLHCPESNLKLASGFCPVQTLLDAGVNVALGTDGAASNNDLDMLGEMRTAALLAKAVANDAQAVAAATALRMATINGARALGLDAITGSLEEGKAADITAVKLDSLETQPVYDPVSQLVYAAGREHVTHVWVTGRHLLDNGKLVDMDEAELLESARSWQQRIADSR